MKTFDDKSEGKTSIHRPKTMFTKYLIFAISFGEKNYNFYIREYSTLYVGLPRAVSPTNTNFRLTFLTNPTSGGSL